MKGFREWLEGKEVGVLNHYRGGLTIENGLVLEGGTALHWAAYCGKYTIVKELKTWSHAAHMVDTRGTNRNT